MAHKDMHKIMLKITDEEHFKKSVIDASDDKLIVLDIHQDWCGICEAIHPTMIRVLTDYDDAENRIGFASADIIKLRSVVQSSFPHECHLSLEKNGCVPIFALYRYKACVAVIVGVDAPQLLSQIENHIGGTLTN